MQQENVEMQAENDLSAKLAKWSKKRKEQKWLDIISACDHNHVFAMIGFLRGG
jgi:hypothetical protein